MLQKVKMALMMRPKAGSWKTAVYRFLGNTGGFDQKFKAIPMTWKDAVIYLVLLLVCAVVVTLVIWALGKLIRGIKGRTKKKPEAEAPEQTESAE